MFTWVCGFSDHLVGEVASSNAQNGLCIGQPTKKFTTANTKTRKHQCLQVIVA